MPPRVSARLSYEDVRALDLIAEAEGTTRSAVLRRLIQAEANAPDDDMPSRVSAIEQRLDDLEMRARVGF